MVLGNEPHHHDGHHEKRLDPRANLIPIAHRSDIRTEIWVGGADTAIGEPVTPAHLRGAWLVDCAGELPASFRAAATACFARVFADVESVPSSFDRVAGLARDLALRLRGSPFGLTKGLDELPAELPSRLYVMCSQGFNRSALVAGLVLRELGAEPAAAVDAIRAARPGSLSNETFVRLVLDAWQPLDG